MAMADERSKLLTVKTVCMVAKNIPQGSKCKLCKPHEVICIIPIYYVFLEVSSPSKPLPLHPFNYFACVLASKDFWPFGL